MRNRLEPNGFALPVAIFAIVVIAVLVTGGFFVARQEARIGLANENATEALYQVETAIAQVQNDWVRSTMLAAMPNQWDTTRITGTNDGYAWNVHITRSGDRIYFLDGTADRTEGGLLSGASRRVGMVMKLITLGIEVPGALTTHGGVGFNGSPGSITGMDTEPGAWSSVCGDTASLPGLMSDDTTGTGDTKSGAPCMSQLTGAPCAEEDSAAVANTLDPLFEDETWDQLVELANHTMGTGNYQPAPDPDAGAGPCNVANISNWGDPDSTSDPCSGFFPIIHITGDVKLNGGSLGQGTILVDGSLETLGSFEFYGVILVRGEIDMGGGSDIYGGILSDSAGALSGNPNLYYSSCSVQRGFVDNDNLNFLFPLDERSWVDLSNVGNEQD